jgi:hypothetical protein
MRFCMICAEIQKAPTLTNRPEVSGQVPNPDPEASGLGIGGRPPESRSLGTGSEGWPTAGLVWENAEGELGPQVVYSVKKEMVSFSPSCSRFRMVRNSSTSSSRC